MNRIYGFFIIIGLLLTALQAGVIRESKSSVGFTGMGKYTQKTVIKLSGLKELEQTRSDFDADNVLMGMAAKFFTGDDNKSTLIDLNAEKIYTIDHEEKTYTVTPIRKLTEEDKQNIDKVRKGELPQTDEDSEQTNEDMQEEESNIKLIRREFKVFDTGEKENINGFDCKKYTLYYVSEWEDTETGERTTDSLFTIVWTTPYSEQLKQINQEEMQFGKAYLKAVGMEVDWEDTKDDILGLNWISMFGQMGKADVEAPDAESADIVKEMQKIEGFPVVIDGSYFVIAPEKEEPEEQEEEEQSTVDVTDMGSLFGAITKQVVKNETQKPQEKKNEAALTYRTELVRYEISDIPESDLSVPAGYKKMEENE